MENDDFEEIYQRYVSKVFAFILQLSGNYHVAEEITQETFAKAYISITSFRGECRLEVWLCQIAKHLFLDYLRQCSRQADTDFMNAEIIDYRKNTEEEVLEKDEIKRLRNVIFALKEPYRTVVIDYLFCELSYKEIALKYHKTENWVRVNFYRGKQKIKRALFEEERGKHYEM